MTPEKQQLRWSEIARKAIFISDHNDYGRGTSATTTIKQIIKAVGLWSAYKFAIESAARAIELRLMTAFGILIRFLILTKRYSTALFCGPLREQRGIPDPTSIVPPRMLRCSVFSNDGL